MLVSYLYSYFSDIDDQWTAVHENRRQRVDLACDAYNEARTFQDYKQDTTPFMLVDDKHKVIFCYLPKVACTSWKSLLTAIQQGRKSMVASFPVNMHPLIHNRGILETNGIRSLNLYGEQEIKERVHNYTKVMAVRDPLERLISAHRDKLLLRNRTDGGTECEMCHGVGQEIISKYRPGATEEELVSGRYATVEELIKYIDNTEQKDLDVHFANYHTLCKPCLINYDYIIKMDTVDKDTDILVPLLFKSNLRLPQYHTTEYKQKSSAISTLTKNSRVIFAKTYGIDFMSFGYPLPK